MIMPSNGNWYHGRELCRRFGGRLHIDPDLESAQNRTIPMVEAGERLRPPRCVRVWLGASDTEQEGEWRDSETGEIIDIASLWTPGQPNGVRVQNCASIWEFVRSRQSKGERQTIFTLIRMGDMMTEIVTRSFNVPCATSNFIPGQP